MADDKPQPNSGTTVPVREGYEHVKPPAPKRGPVEQKGYEHVTPPKPPPKTSSGGTTNGKKS
jgi:hypothetical protein